jgi:hypothetical protein
MTKNWVVIIKKIREIIHSYPDSSLCQAKYITDFIRENFLPEKKTKIFKERR